jgi:hypothetical protein
MTIKHGTDRRYSDGCRCDECREAHKLKAREYRDRKRRGLTRHAFLTAVMSMESSGPGLVELALESELAGLAAAQLRPGHRFFEPRWPLGLGVFSPRASGCSWHLPGWGRPRACPPLRGLD